MSHPKTQVRDSVGRYEEIKTKLHTMGAWYIHSFDDEAETRHTSRRPSKMGTCTLTQVRVAVYTRTAEIQEHESMHTTGQRHPAL